MNRQMMKKVLSLSLIFALVLCTLGGTLSSSAAKDTMTVVFDPDDGVAEYPNYYKTEVACGERITDKPQNPERDGYTFGGWAYAFGGDNADIPMYWNFDKKIAADEFSCEYGMTLWAVWEKNAEPEPEIKYTVSYDANGGDGGQHFGKLEYGTMHGVQYPEAVSVLRLGYTFAGWNTSADGTGTSHAAGSVLRVTEDVTMYAQWEKQAEETKEGLLEKLEHRVYLEGYQDGSVRADMPITRAETAAIFYRLLKVQGNDAGNRFRDVPNTAWHAQAVNYLASLGILNGYADGGYRPDTAMTRAEFAALVSRFDTTASGQAASFGDVPNAHWAYGAIRSASAIGWIGGYPDGTFRPEESITRAEVVTIVNRMLDRRIRKDDIPADFHALYTDLTPQHWAFAAVIEASVEHEYTRDADGFEHWDQ